MNIIITGASRGIGYELTKLFAIENNTILIIARNTGKLKLLKQECLGINRKAVIHDLPYDLSKEELIDELPGLIKERMSQIDILINNAGAMVNKGIADLTPADFDYLFMLNVKSVFFLVQSMKSLFSDYAHIVNIGSMGGVQGSSKFPGLSLYSASKGALAVLSECMAEEFKENGIKVNCLALGAAQTEMLGEAFPGYKAPLTAREMASFVKEFSLKGHRYFNGKILPVSVSTP